MEEAYCLCKGIEVICYDSTPSGPPSLDLDYKNFADKKRQDGKRHSRKQMLAEMTPKDGSLVWEFANAKG